MILATITGNNAFVPFDYVKSMLALKGKHEFLHAFGPSLPDNRNEIFSVVKAHNDDLLFIDSDIVFTPQDIRKMEIHLKILDVVTGVYILVKEKMPDIPAIFKRIEGNYNYTKVEQGIFKIGACGGGFLGISKKVIQALPSNPFDNILEGTVYHGEDISFCHRVNELGFTIWCDSSIRVGQVRTMNHYYVA